MQAIGQLAGGIAHDFNNLLTVINSSVAMLLDQTSRDRPGFADLAAIRDAGERAAQLTRQLLLFSRKAVSEAKLLDLNQAVQRASQMLLRLIGEHIQLDIAPGADLPAIKADPAQVEQVLLNLALNGRDALPAGGTLRIATSATEIGADDPRLPPAHKPGRYVRLLVEDNGTGMSPEIQAHLFEPFFTTKGVGKGTGLGLATVFGIVEASDGFVSVTSAPDSGTRVEVFLPAMGDTLPAESGPVAEAPAPHGHETVLLVEDEDDVRRVAERMITDEVMPGISGHTLADAVRRQVPGCPVLFVSGYSARDMHDGGHGAPGSAFLQKPFTPPTLARKVRELLDRGP
jgi:CheY-like chemotaxis protein